jgi:hypothetical protein
VWNRVFLLASGFLFGWSLVRYWTVPRAQMNTHALRLGIALAVGGAVIVLLAIESSAAAVAGLAVYVVSAVAAYAGNARQVNRVEVPAPATRPMPTGTEAGWQGVVLVSCLEPPAYDGPGYWAWRLRRRESVGEPVPHWFVRPRAYARIRSAYQALSSGASSEDSSSIDALRRVGQDLSAALGAGYRVATVRISAPPSLARVLADLAGDGARRVIVQPLDVPPDAMDDLREAVTDSRVREVGVRVTLADPLPVPAWDSHEKRLDQWIAGRPPDPLPDPDPTVVARLQSWVVALER